jgi:hypothetical protein
VVLLAICVIWFRTPAAAVAPVATEGPGRAAPGA